MKLVIALKKALQDNLLEYYLLLLLVVVLPVAIALYLDWRAGLLVSVIVQVVIGVFAIVGKGGKQ